MQERVATLDRLVRAVGQAGRLAGEELLADQAVIGQIEGVLQHSLRGRRFPVDLARPLQGNGFQLGVRHDGIDRAHRMHVLGGVGAAQEEDLPGELLADHLGEIGAAVTAVEGSHVSIGLLEPRMISGGERQIADHVERMAPARGPAGDDGDDDLGHETD